MPTKNEELIQNKRHEVVEKLSHQDFFHHYILETLDSFAYRYFESPAKAEAHANSVFSVSALELGIKDAIKIKNPALREGIGELVKRVSKAEGPTIKRELRVQLLEKNSQKGGKCRVSARISFGHPEHSFLPGTFVEKSSDLLFEDDIHLRNALAKSLEEVCELFS